MDFFQYLKDTQGELRHVAWPTRLQTIVYTILVALLSIVVALYLGFFDYIFTSTLKRFLQVHQAVPPITVTQQPVATSSSAVQPTTTPATPQFKIQPSTTTKKK